MTFVCLLDGPRAPASAPDRLHRADVLLAIRRIALDLDAEGACLASFGKALGEALGRSTHRALAGLVMTLCCHGRRPFVVGHPRSPLPSTAERHVLALLAAAQRHADHEVDVRLASLLPPPWRAQARTDLATVAAVLVLAGVPAERSRPVPPPRCPGWADRPALMAP